MSLTHVGLSSQRDAARPPAIAGVASRIGSPPHLVVARAALVLAAGAFGILSAPRDPLMLILAGVAVVALLGLEVERSRRLQFVVDALRVSESRHRTLLASIPQHVIVKDRDLVLRSINRAVALDLGLPESDVIGKTDFDLYPAQLAEAYRQTDREVMAAREPRRLVERNISAAGDQVVDVTKAPIVEADGRVSGVMILYEDVTDRVAAEEAQRLLSSVVDTANDAIYTLTPDGRVRTWNAAAEQLFGVTAHAMAGRTMAAFVPADLRGEFDGLIAAAVSGSRVTRHEMTGLTATGSPLQLEISAAPVRASDGSITAVSVIARDVTERHVLLDQLRAAAFRDAVTGLGNRALFVERLHTALAQRATLPINVIFLDLDDFKDVNDRYGHPAGDALLEAVGSRLTTELRAGDVVARFGGDEFAVLLLGVDPDTAMEVAARICSALARPFDLDGRPTPVRASLGVASAGTESDIDADELLRRADVALYEAKRSGKGAVRRFDRDGQG